MRRHAATIVWFSRLLLAALNVDPPKGSAGLAGAIVKETLLAGGHACRPLIARDGLSAVLIDPALKLLREKGAQHQLRSRTASGVDGGREGLDP